jgi:hypothetical protein
VPCERPVHLDLGVGVERLDAPRHRIRLCRRAVLVQHLQISSEGADVVRETLGEIREGSLLFVSPPETPIQHGKLLEDFRLAPVLVCKRAQGLYGLRGTMLLRIVEDVHQPRSPKPTVASKRLVAERACARAAALLGERRIAEHADRSQLERDRRRILRGRERLDERRRDVIHLFDVRFEGAKGRLDRGHADRHVTPGDRGHDLVERIQVFKESWWIDAERCAEVAARRDSRGRPVGREETHARRRRQRTGEHPVPSLSHRYVGAEALPRAPLVHSSFQDRHAVDPDGDCALDGDDEVHVAADCEECLRVKDAVLHLLVRNGKAALLRNGKHVRDAAAHLVRGPRRRPRCRALRWKRADAVTNPAVAKWAGETHALRAAHAPDDVLVVRVAGSFRCLMYLYGAPILEIGDGSPSKVTRARQQRVEHGSVPGEEVDHRAAKTHQMAHGEPTDDGSLRLAAGSGGDHGRHERVRRRTRISVGLVDHRSRKTCPHPGVGQAVQALASRRCFLRRTSRSEDLGQRPATHELSVRRRRRRGAKLAEGGRLEPAP